MLSNNLMDSKIPKTFLPLFQPEKVFAEDVILITDLQSTVAGELQLLPSEEYFLVTSSAASRRHAYLIEVPLRLTNKDNVQYARTISNDDFLDIGATPVYSAGEGDWTTPTWNNPRLSLFLDVYRQPLSKIAEARRLPDKWNSYDAHRIAKETSFRAADVLVEAFLIFFNLGVDAIVPFVAPCPDGSMQLEWELNQKELEIVVPFSIDQKIRVVKSEEEGIVESVVNSHSDMTEHLLWLLKD